MSKSILYITQYQPGKMSCGTEIRAHHIRRALEHIGKVHVVVAEPQEQPCPTTPDATVLNTFPVSSKRQTGTLRKLRWIFDSHFIFPHGTGVDVNADMLLQRYSREYDLVWFNKLRTANFLSTWHWPNSVVDVDDVPSTYEYSMIINQTQLKDKLMSAIRYFSWRRREQLLGARFNVIAVCSQPDRDYLERLKVTVPIHIIPNGSTHIKNLVPRRPSMPPRIGFVGLLDYYPNSEGMRWFIEKCWPLVKAEIPDARLRIAGKGSTEMVNPGYRDIDALGYISDLEAETSTWSVIIVPIRIGAGTREKIAYGFGIQCPIVSTPLGVSGYDVQNGEELLIAGSANEFAGSCVRIIRNDMDTAAMIQNAYRKFLLHWTWDAIAPRIWKAAEDCFRLSRESRSEHAPEMA